MALYTDLDEHAACDGLESAARDLTNAIQIPFLT